MQTDVRRIVSLLLGLLLVSMSIGALAHGVDDDPRLFTEDVSCLMLLLPWLMMCYSSV